MSLNEANLIGHLGGAPEVRSLNNGGEVVSFSLATSERWRDKNKQQQERTEWHRIVVFSEGLVGIAKTYLKKGSKVFIRGQLRTRKWQAQDGGDRYSTEVVLQGFDAKLQLLDRREGDPGRHDYGSHQDDRQGAATGGGQAGRGAFDTDLDDDVPF